MNGELISRLGDLATQPTLGPDAAFADDLERRLRDAASARSEVVILEPRPRPLRRRLVVSGSIAVVAVAAAAIAAVVVPDATTHPRVQLAGATDSQVIDPNGRIGAAAPGAIVPDGSIIRTGPSGQILAGGVVIGPNQDAVAVDGRLHPVTSDLARDRRLAEGVGHTGGLHLEVRRAATGDALRWTRFTGRGLYGYLVLAASGAADPDSTSDAIGLTAGTSSIQHVAGDVTYRIVAVDRQGRVLASSNDISVG